MKKKESKSKSNISNNLFFLRLIWKIAPGAVIHTFVSQVIGFGLWAFYSITFMQYLFGGVDRTFTEVLIFIWAAVIIDILFNLYVSWFNYKYMPVASADIHRELNSMLFKKSQAMDLSCYETPEFYNSYTKAATEASNRSMIVLQTMAVIVSAALSVAYVVYTMCSVTLWSLVFVVLPLIGNLYFGRKFSKVQFQLETDNVPFDRRKDYVNRVVYFRKYAGELRLTSIFKALKSTYRDAAQNIVDIARKHAPKKSFYNIIKGILLFCLSFQGMWAVGAFLALRGDIDLGGFIVLSSAIVSLTWMSNDLTQSITESFTNSLFIENLKTFLNYTPKIDEDAGGLTPESNVQTIEFRNVTFTYPGQEKPALENVNLTFNRGVRHALVGINGSGKSTLLKLILRFYDPEAGTILLNGTDIKTLDVKKYRELIGVAFQDFAMFSSTVTENVLLRESADDDDTARAVAALKDSGVYDKIETLENGINSILTREFDDNGIELSGGERQKIAIARAFAKNSPVVILDEPSSALDPIAEYQMFETINHLCKGEDKLSIIVSHRLSTAATSDKIFMFENGSIIEQGSHSVLLEQGGKYAEMFKKQAENYLVQTGGGVDA